MAGIFETPVHVAECKDCGWRGTKEELGSKGYAKTWPCPRCNGRWGPRKDHGSRASVLTFFAVEADHLAAWMDGGPRGIPKRYVPQPAR